MINIAFFNKKIFIVVVLSILAITFFGFYAKNTPVAYAEAIFYADDIFAGGGESALIENEYSYTSKTVETSFKINPTFPNYFNTNTSLSNGCASVAGANVIGFFDRTATNLIPNFEPGVQRPTAYLYTGMSSNTSVKQGLINELYNLMDTNSLGPGTSQSQYKAGLQDYVTSKGYGIGFFSVMSNGTINVSALLNQLQAGNPVTLYLSGYNLSSISEVGNTLIISKNLFSTNHMMIVFGLEKVSYYNNGQKVYEGIHLIVADGMNFNGFVYILNNNGVVNDAEAIAIS